MSLNIKSRITPILFFTFLFVSTKVISQDIATPGGGNDPGDGGPLGGAVPVDGGLALLLAAGAGYGAKKAYDYRKSQKAKGKS
jgi:hypothetical protein